MLVAKTHPRQAHVMYDMPMQAVTMAACVSLHSLFFRVTLLVIALERIHDR